MVVGRFERTVAYLHITVAVGDPLAIYYLNITIAVAGHSESKVLSHNGCCWGPL